MCCAIHYCCYQKNILSILSKAVQTLNLIFQTSSAIKIINAYIANFIDVHKVFNKHEPHELFYKEAIKCSLMF